MKLRGAGVNIIWTKTLADCRISDGRAAGRHPFVCLSVFLSRPAPFLLSSPQVNQRHSSFDPHKHAETNPRFAQGPASDARTGKRMTTAPGDREPKVAAGAPGVKTHCGL